MIDEEEHSESECYYPDELEFQDNSDFTETNYERRKQPRRVRNFGEGAKK